MHVLPCPRVPLEPHFHHARSLFLLSCSLYHFIHARTQFAHQPSSHVKSQVRRCCRQDAGEQAECDLTFIGKHRKTRRRLLKILPGSKQCSNQSLGWSKTSRLAASASPHSLSICAPPLSFPRPFLTILTEPFLCLHQQDFRKKPHMVLLTEKEGQTGAKEREDKSNKPASIKYYETKEAAKTATKGSREFD